MNLLSVGSNHRPPNMTIAEHTAKLASALNAAFVKGSSLAGSYLDNLSAHDYEVLTLLWKYCGEGHDSRLSYAEKIRKNRLLTTRQG